MGTSVRRPPGEIRDAIVAFLRARNGDASVAEVFTAVQKRVRGDVARSSVRSYLQIGTGIERTEKGRYQWKA